MKQLQVTVLATALLFSPFSFAQNECDDDASVERVAKYNKTIKAFGKNLKQELQQAIKDKGIEHAVTVCHKQSDEITSNHSRRNNFYLGRTSLKVRNLSNIADEWETKVLKEFEKRKAAGENVADMNYIEVIQDKDKRQIRYMKAIGTAPVCLSCHGGEQISADVAKKIESLYPEDLAKGYTEGDIRGGFSISENVETCK